MLKYKYHIVIPSYVFPNSHYLWSNLQLSSKILTISYWRVFGPNYYEHLKWRVLALKCKFRITIPSNTKSTKETKSYSLVQNIINILVESIQTKLLLVSQWWRVLILKCKFRITNLIKHKRVLKRQNPTVYFKSFITVLVKNTDKYYNGTMMRSKFQIEVSLHIWATITYKMQILQLSTKSLSTS